MRCCAVERGCLHPEGEGHVYCPFHGSIVGGYPQPNAAACHHGEGWQPTDETKAMLTRAQFRRPEEARRDG